MPIYFVRHRRCSEVWFIFDLDLSFCWINSLKFSVSHKSSLRLRRRLCCFVFEEAILILFVIGAIFLLCTRWGERYRNVDLLSREQLIQDGRSNSCDMRSVLIGYYLRRCKHCITASPNYLHLRPRNIYFGMHISIINPICDRGDFSSPHTSIKRVLSRWYLFPAARLVKFDHLSWPVTSLWRHNGKCSRAQMCAYWFLWSPWPILSI